MDLNNLLGAVSRLITDRTGPSPDVDTNGFLGEVAGLFRQHGEATGQQVDDQYANQYQGQYPGPGGDQYQGQEVLPASMDPLGDPADQEQTILPASQDPLGDPADQQRY